MASPRTALLRSGCCRLPLGTCFYSSCKPSISLSICTGTSSCEVGTPAFLTIFTPFQTQVRSTVASPRIVPLRAGCCQLPLGTSFHSSHKPSISLSINTGISRCKEGTPTFLTISTTLQTPVHSIVASPRTAPLRAGCCRLPFTTSFHSNHKSSISISNVNSSCEVGIPAFRRISSQFQTLVHFEVVSPRIAPPRTGCCRLPLGTSVHSGHEPSISLSICTGTSSCKVGIPAFLAISTPFHTKVHSIVASPLIAPPRAGCPRVPLGTFIILAISRQYLYRFVLASVVAKCAPQPF